MRYRCRSEAKEAATKSEPLVGVGRWSVVASSLLSLLFVVGASYGAFVADGAPAGLPSYTFGANPLS